jgi:hypothetical protein
VIVGVRVGVLLGGSVGVISTKPDSKVTILSDELTSEVETGMLIGDGVGLRTRVGAGVVGARVTSLNSTGPLSGFASCSGPQAAANAARSTNKKQVKRSLMFITCNSKRAAKRYK